MLKNSKKQAFIKLIRKHLEGRSTVEESRFLELYYLYFDKKEPISGELSARDKVALEEKLLDKINLGILNAKETPVIPLFRKASFRIAASVAALIMLAAGAHLWFGWGDFAGRMVNNSIYEQKNDVLPGGNKAVLTLSNGQTIILDSAPNGTLSHQGNTKVLKVNSGQLTYAGASTTSSDKALLFNTITTPRGGQYLLILSDGSKVWLNAASSLRFPIAFTGDTRKVELTGEAYFEIAQNSGKPFKVHLHAAGANGNTEVQVLGTHFNIMAYGDESAIKTTLLEGAVNISSGGTNTLLKPGQRADINKTIPGIKVATANIDEELAWKNGLFQFDNDDMASIMRKVSRWYDVEVAYNNGVPEGHFTGVVSRKTNLSEVLQILELSGLHFKIENKRIIVQ